MFQVRKKIFEKSKEGTLKISNGETKQAPKKRGRWDQTVDESPAPSKKKPVLSSVMATPSWDNDVSSKSTFLYGRINLGYRIMWKSYFERPITEFRIFAQKFPETKLTNKIIV